MPSGLRVVGWSLLYLALVLYARNLTLQTAGQLPVSLIAPSAGIGLVWLASARTRGEMVTDSIAAIAATALGLWVADAAGWTTSVSAAMYVSSVLIPVMFVVPVLLMHRWLPHLWGGGGRRSMRSPPEFVLVLLAMVIGVLAYSVLRTGFGALYIPQETWSVALGRAARSLSAMATIGVVGLLVGGWLAECRDAGRPAFTKPTLGEVATLVGAAAVAIFVLDFDFFLTQTQAPTTFLLMLVIVWIALRFNPLVTGVFSLVCGAAIITLTIQGHGPLSVVDDLVLRAALAQLLVVVLMVLGMVISLSRRQVLDTVAVLRRSQEANARRANELDLVMANLHDGVAIIEEGGRILHANTALRTAFGTQEPNQELDRVRDDSAIPDEERLIRGSDGRLFSDETSPLPRALAGETVPPEEWRAPDPNGPIQWVTISAVPLPPEEGGPARAMVVLRDITAQKAHQQQLEARAAELNMVIDNLNDGLAIVEEGGTYTQANDALRTIFFGRPDVARSEGPIEGPAAYHLFHPDGRPLEDGDYPYQRALRGIVVRDEEQHLRRPDSPTQILNVSSFPLPDESGRPRRAVVVVRDITLERSYQDGLASFAGTVAHDLNNPLSVIDGWAEAIQEDLAESEDPMAAGAASMVTHIRAGVAQMRGFISDLLAHAVARDQTLRCELVSLERMVKHIATQRDRPELHDGGIEHADLPDVWADQLLVRQVLDNLIGNASKYVAPGVVPAIRVSASTRSDGWVEVRVSDNGIGIDPAQRERIFESFHRASRQGYAGTGLGLAICKRIVERHGGQIRVESNPTGGSTFVFTLPSSASVFAAATAG